MNIPNIISLANDVYRYAYNNDERIKGKIVDFYNEGAKCPSVAKVIAKKAMTDGIKRYGEALRDDAANLRGKPGELIKNYLFRIMLAFVNIEKAKEDPDIEKHYDVFQKEFIRLYKKTHAIREQIINDGRVVYGQVTPIKTKGIKTIYKYRKLFAQAKL